jgi:hypothetical protein
MSKIIALSKQSGVDLEGILKMAEESLKQVEEQVSQLKAKYVFLLSTCEKARLVEQMEVVKQQWQTLEQQMKEKRDTFDQQNPTCIMMNSYRHFDPYQLIWGKYKDLSISELDTLKVNRVKFDQEMKPLYSQADEYKEEMKQYLQILDDLDQLGKLNPK